jgi:hypothetical protein
MVIKGDVVKRGFGSVLGGMLFANGHYLHLN